MALSMLSAVDFTKIPALNLVLPVVSSDPTGYEAGLIYNSTTKEIKYHNGTSWVTLGPAGAGGPPTGAAGGDLSGSYPNPQIATGVIVDTDVAAANKDGAAATPILRTLGLGAQQALGGTTRLDQIAVPTAAVSLNAQKLTNVADPTAASDGATKNYVDSMVQGLDAKASVRAATVGANITLAGSAPSTLDGVTLAANDRVLVKDQTAQAQNGIYVVTTLGTGANGTWTRAADMDAWVEVPNAYVWVEGGATYADSGWVCSSDPGGTLGTTAILWLMFSAASGTLQAGAGLTKTGTTLDVVSATADMTVNPDSITINSAPKWTTARTITLTGDVTSSAVSIDGSANISIATTVAVAGTAPKHFAGDVPAGTACVITHSLNTRDVDVQVYRNTSPWDTVICDVERTSTTTVTLRFASSVAAAAFRCVVIGR